MEREYLQIAQQRADDESPLTRVLAEDAEIRDSTGQVIPQVSPESMGQPDVVLPIGGTPRPGTGEGVEGGKEGESGRGTPGAPAAPAAPTSGATAPAEGRDILPSSGGEQGIARELGFNAVVGGIRDLTESLLTLPRDVQSAIESLASKARGAAGLELTPEQRAQAEATVPQALQTLGSIVEGVDPSEALAKVSELIPEVAAPESVAGSLVRALTQFGVPFAGALGSARKVVGAAKAGEGLLKRTGREALAAGGAGAVADLTAFDPNDPRFSNFLMELHPALRNPFTEFLAAPEGDELALEDRLSGRLKNVIEGAALGVSVDSLVLLARGARQLQRARAFRKKVEGAEQAAQTAGPAGFQGQAAFQEGAQRAETGVQRIEDLATRGGQRPRMTAEVDAVGAQRIVEQTLTTGGATYNVATGKIVPKGTPGFAVSIAPEREVTLNRPLTPDDVINFARQSADIFGDERVHLGSWVDGQKLTHLDLSIVVQNREEGMEIGRQFNQKALYDLAAGEEIPIPARSSGHPYDRATEPMSEQDITMAREYDRARTDESARAAWDALAQEIDKDFEVVSRELEAANIRLERVTGQPYANAQEMFDDIQRGIFKVTTDNSDHPFWTVDQNWKFRVVHDWRGHMARGNDFSLKGEFQAWLAHAERVQDETAKKALQVEVYGQAASAVANGQFGPQKAFIPQAVEAPVSIAERLSAGTVQASTQTLAERAAALAKERLGEIVTVVRDQAGVIHLGPAKVTVSRHPLHADFLRFKSGDTDIWITTHPESKEIEVGMLELGLGAKKSTPDLLRVLSGLSEFAQKNGFKTIVGTVVNPGIGRLVRKLGAQIDDELLFPGGAFESSHFSLDVGKLPTFESVGAELTKDVMRRLSTVGAAVIARGARDAHAFRRGLLEAVGQDPELNLDRRQVKQIYEQAQKVYARHVQTAVRTRPKPVDEPGADLFIGTRELPEGDLPVTSELLQRMNTEGAFLQDWYKGAREELQRTFGEDWELVADVIAALSPRARAVARTEKELGHTDVALRFYAHWKNGGSIDDFGSPGSADHGFVNFKSRRPNLERALKRLPFPDTSPKVRAFAANIKGDANAVTVDTWLQEIFFPGRSRNLQPSQISFVQEWVRLEARKAGVEPRQFQAAIWVAKKMQEEFLMPDDPELKSMKDVIRDTTRKLYMTGALELPPDLLNEEGFSRVGGLLFMARVAAGALVGGTQGETLEERVRNALLGSGAGAAMSPALLGRVSRSFADRIAQAPKVRKSPTRPAKTPITGAGAEPIKPTATSFRTLADQYSHEVDVARRGTRPREQSLAEAQAIRSRFTPDAIRQLMPSITLDDSEAIALVQVMTDLGQNLRSLAERATKENYSEESVREFLKQLYLYAELDPKRLGAIAEAGRTLGAMNDPVSGMNQFLKQFEDLLRDSTSGVSAQRLIEATNSFKTPQQLATFAMQLTKPGWRDAFYEVWINGLLSGPKTFVVNGLSNSTFLLWNVGERSLASSISRGRRGGIAPEEGAAMLHGIVEAQKDAWRLFWTLMSPRTGLDEDILRKAEFERSRPVTSQVLGMTGAPGRALDYLVTLPGRALGAADKSFKALATRAELRALARRESFHEVQRLGLKGKQALDKMHELEQTFLADPPVTARRKAEEFASYVTFQKELGPAGVALQDLRREMPMGKLIVPFVRTPINIFKTGTERLGPLGLVTRKLREEIQSADPAVRDLALAKLSLSSMTLAMFGAMAAGGYLTGGGPKDPELRKQWRDSGWAPYSFDLGALLGRTGPPKEGDLISFNRIEPIGMLMGIMTDAVDVMGHLGDEEAEELAMQLAAAFAKNFTSKTFVKGIAQTTALMTDPERYGASALGSTLSSFMPFSGIAGQAAQALDPEILEARGIVDRWLARIHLGGTASHDLFGNKRHLGGGLGRYMLPPSFQPAVDFVSPIYLNSASKEHQDIFFKLKEEGIRAPEAPESIEGIKLTTTARERLKVIAGKEITNRSGKTLPEAMRDLFASRMWEMAGKEGRQSLVDRLVRSFYGHEANQAAKGRLLEEFPDLRNAVMNVRVERARAAGLPESRMSPILQRIGVE